MGRKKFDGIESQLAASILYYDKEELSNILSIYDQLVSNSNIAIDGVFDSFIRYLKKLTGSNKFEEIINLEDPENRKIKIVSYLNNLNEQNPDSKARSNFELWIEYVLTLETQMELSEDLVNHFLWEEFKKSIDLLDKSEISFKDKLNVRPQVFSHIQEDEIITLDEIDLEEEKEEAKYTTGVDELDKIIELVETNFMVIAARPGVGKSLFMLNMAIANARKGIKTLYVSLEMNKKQVSKRIINNYANENLKDKFKDEYGVLDFAAYKAEYNSLKASRGFKPINENLQLWVSKESSADVILNKMEKRIKDDGYEAVFIDYLQLLKYNRIDEWASLRKLTKELKSMAFRLNILVVTGSQVSRSSTEHGLYLSDLFGSSTIEADTDIVLGLENPREQRQGEKAVIQLKALKNRENPLADVKSIIDYSTGRIIIQ